jgi:uncharacterized protein DUF3291
VHLAQVNIALPREPLDSPALAEFVAALEPINALADASPGFVWRLQTEEGDATGIRAFGDDRLIVNMSVWESLPALRAFVYSSGHREVLWWVPAATLPTIAAAEARLEHLREHGPTPYAFTFRESFPPAGGPVPVRDDGELCPAG